MVLSNIDGNMLKDMFLSAAKNLERHKEMINALNVYPVPDGDTGTNMSLTMKSAVKGLVDGKDKSVKEVIEAVTKGSLMGARGNSGVILSQIIRGFGKGLENEEEITVRALSYAFREATDTAYRAVMKPTEGTILTVARGCSDAAYELSRTETDIAKFVKEVIKAGNETLDRTPEMLPVLKEAGVVDAGGKGYITILEGMLSVLTGEKLDYSGFEQAPAVQAAPAQLDANIEFGYCTEFIINNTHADPDKFREELDPLGDSMLVIGGDDIIKVHIHTNNPGDVLERAVKLGELIDIKIDNMRYQHSHNNFSNEEVEKAEESAEMKKYGIISVSVGEGLSELFKEIGVDKIISGGQTMNPSTEDIMKAVDSMNAENIIILPNNSNIILAASQAKSISEKNVEVVPTKSVQAGISALLAFNPEAEMEENVENMIDAYEQIKTGQITFSVKDTSINGTEIKKGDIMGLMGKEIICTGKEVPKVTLDVIDRLSEETPDIITIIYGEDVKESDAEELFEIVEEKYSDSDVELINGGQPLYHYLISVE